MISNILEMLEVAKEQEIMGKYIFVALGKNKIPMSIVEAYKQQNREKWLKK